VASDVGAHHTAVESAVKCPALISFYGAFLKGTNIGKVLNLNVIL
jgi:hypothetical protein